MTRCNQLHRFLVPFNFFFSLSLSCSVRITFFETTRRIISSYYNRYESGSLFVGLVAVGFGETIGESVDETLVINLIPCSLVEYIVSSEEGERKKEVIKD